MDEVKRVTNYIRSCRESGIDVTITIDKSRSHLVLNALEKQMPKKVLRRQGLKNFNNDIYAIRGSCPECGMEGLLSTNTDYCYRCGQKLDWN